MPRRLEPNSIVPTIPYKATRCKYPPYAVACPACGAPIKHLCITSSNQHFVGGTHKVRANIARKMGYYK